MSDHPFHVAGDTRADLSALQALQADNAQLRRQLDEARREVEAQRAEKSRETHLLGQRVAELRIDLAGKEAYAASLTGQLDALRRNLPELKDRQALARRASDAESRASALTAHAAELEKKVDRLRKLANQSRAETALP